MRTAELLRLAANEHLRPTCGFTCFAIQRASETEGEMYRAYKFIRTLGLDTDAVGLFNEFRHGRVRQSVRYAWLMFAADIADEWGVE